MRRRAIGKIIVCSIIGVILTAVLLGGTAAALAGKTGSSAMQQIESFLGNDSIVRKAIEETERAFRRLPVPKLHFFGCAPVISFSDSGSGKTVSEKDGYQKGNMFYAGKPESLTVEWAAGRILIATHSMSEGVYLYEYNGKTEHSVSAAPEIPANEVRESDRMVHRYENGALKIQEYAESVLWPVGETPVKTLVVAVPEGILRKLKIEAAAADLEILDVDALQLDLDCASGKIFASGCEIGEANIDCAAVSGEFKDCLVGSIDLDSAGAMFTFELDKTPSKIDVDGAAGSYKFVLPRDASFSVKADTLAGTVSINGFATKEDGRKTVVNGGDSTFDFDLMSGSVTIEAAPHETGGTSF